MDFLTLNGWWQEKTVQHAIFATTCFSEEGVGP